LKIKSQLVIKANRILPKIYRVVEYGVHVIPDIAPPRICAGNPQLLLKRKS
jgi:hypothetical protein